MLNIPETVKALFKQDGVRKNFRAHFPNGELADLTNDNIVQESVRFTESLCSQDVLKFGLTEASTIEFETVGVANMYGMTIECGIEIDCSSLGDEWAEDNPIDSTLDWLTPQTCTYDSKMYYRVPYGVFRVESCPRDHQAMTHRKVTAYGFLNQTLKLSPIEEEKLALFIEQNESFTGDLKNALLGNIGYYNPQVFVELGYTKTQVSSFGGDVYYPYSIYIEPTSVASNSSFRLNFYLERGIFSGDSLYCGEIGNYDLNYEEAASWLDENVSLANHTVKDWNGNIISCSDFSQLFTLLPYPISMPVYWEMSTTSGGRVYRHPHELNENGLPVVWLYRGRTISLLISVISKIELYRVVDTRADLIKTWNAQNISDVVVYRYDASNTEIPITFNSTLQITNGGTKYYSYINSYSVRTLMNGYLELIAKFGKVNRSGDFEIMALSDSAPAQIIPSEYSQFWWDEYDIQPIGIVQYTMAAEDSDGTAEYQFGIGSSVYDMTGNDLIDRMTTATTSDIEDILAETFVPNLDPIAFTPIDLEMKGLPYIEAGDYLAVTAEDGTIAYSYAMRQEISGIQVLTAAIESTGGEIINSEGDDE